MLNMTLASRFARLVNAIVAAAAVGLLFGVATESARAEGKLKIYLLCGQSNMEGHGYCHQEGDDWLKGIGYPDATAIEYLINNPDYVKKLDAEKFSVLKAFNAEWMKPRTDVWAIHMDSGSGKGFKVKHTTSATMDQWVPGERPLQCGFGNQANNVSKFGPELGLGHCLGDALESPIYLYKSDRGGTALAGPWLPPSAAKKRGRPVGDCYTNTVRIFKEFLKKLDADLADDGKLNAYAAADGYEVCGFVWLQGWNDGINADRVKEYQENLIDLVRDLRKDLGLPELPAVIIESSDQKAEMNEARQGAVAALNKDQPNKAVFIPTGGLMAGYRGGFHFEARAEIYLEIGWRAGQAILKNNYTGSAKVDEAK